jgi:hypothetical protein
MGLERRVGSSGRMTEATGNGRTSMRATDKPFNWRVCLMEPDEPRGSRPVLREARGATPRAYSPSLSHTFCISGHLATHDSW